jgi:hypothetical protein
LNKKFWEELIVYFPLIRNGPHRKQKVVGETYRKRERRKWCSSERHYIWGKKGKAIPVPGHGGP